METEDLVQYCAQNPFKVVRRIIFEPKPVRLKIQKWRKVTWYWPGRSRRALSQPVLRRGMGRLGPFALGHMIITWWWSDLLHRLGFIVKRDS